MRNLTCGTCGGLIPVGEAIQRSICFERVAYHPGDCYDVAGIEQATIVAEDDRRDAQV